jgi:hypothetical protein
MREFMSRGDRSLEAVERTKLPADTFSMTKKPEPPEPIRWTIYKLAAKRLWLGTVETADGREAIEKAAADRAWRAACCR